MSNVLLIGVENPDEILNAGHSGAGAVVQVQSSATETGVYTDDGTVAIVTGVRGYTYYDTDGSASTWYQTRYETSAGTPTSDWSAPFQTGDETGGLLASLYDAKQELGETGTANDELILDKIQQVSTSIELYTGRWFAPRPLSGTTTYAFHSDSGLRFRMPKGIRSITTLEYATAGQPETGGTYSTAAAADYYLDPVIGDRSTGWPATAIHLRRETSSRFYDATFGLRITGAFGWASVPHDIQGVAIRAAVRRYIGKAGGGVAVGVGPSGTEFLLPDMSGADRRTLEMYRDIASLVAS